MRTVAIAGGALLIVVALVAGWSRSPRTVPAPAITVVAAARQPDAPIPAVRPAAGATPAVAADVAAARIRRAYPFLAAATLRCGAAQCTLEATVPPVYDQRDLDARQAMLLGGLAAQLARDGYAMAVPFAFEEVDDNRFRLVAQVTPTG